MPQLYLKLKLECDLENTCKEPTKVKGIVVTHALLTMGKYMDHAQVNVVDGVVEFNHNFEALAEGNNYEDELKLTKPTTNAMLLNGVHFDPAVPTDHVILWLYRVHSGTDTCGAHRVYLLGAVALDLVLTLKATVTEYSVRPSFLVKHNFAKSTVQCTVEYVASEAQKAANVAYCTQLELWQKEYAAADAKLMTFEVENKIRHAPKGNILFPVVPETPQELVLLAGLDVKTLASHLNLINQVAGVGFVPSALKRLAETNEIVQLEQGELRKKMYH